MESSFHVVQRAQLGRKEVGGKRDERDEVRHQMKGVPFHHPSSSVNNLIWSSSMACLAVAENE